jgi:2-polyprenyl-3-methyl-5-hydroxy-6-metoxy-1,4-benzoquinol methylase
MTTSAALPRHYDRLAPAFNAHWAYSPAYVAWMTNALTEQLRLGRTDRLIDIGCGTALYTRRLADAASETVALDPSAAMLDQHPRHPRMTSQLAAAEQLAAGTVLAGQRFDAMLLKEVIHHLTDRQRLIRDLARRLTPGGRLVIAKMPDTLDHHPLFTAAKQRFARGTLTTQRVADWMRDAGLAVTTTRRAHQVTMPTEHYCTLVANRYMSLLNKFTDTELVDGIHQIRATHGTTLAFDDTYDFVTGITEKTAQA